MPKVKFVSVACSKVWTYTEVFAVDDRGRMWCKAWKNGTANGGWVLLRSPIDPDEPELEDALFSTALTATEKDRREFMPPLTNGGEPISSPTMSPGEPKPKPVGVAGEGTEMPNHQPPDPETPSPGSLTD